MLHHQGGMSGILWPRAPWPEAPQLPQPPMPMGIPAFASRTAPKDEASGTIPPPVPARSSTRPLGTSLAEALAGSAVPSLPRAPNFATAACHPAPSAVPTTTVAPPMAAGTLAATSVTGVAAPAAAASMVLTAMGASVTTAPREQEDEPAIEADNPAAPAAAAAAAAAATAALALASPAATVTAADAEPADVPAPAATPPAPATTPATPAAPSGAPASAEGPGDPLAAPELPGPAGDQAFSASTEVTEDLPANGATDEAGGLTGKTRIGRNLFVADGPRVNRERATCPVVAPIGAGRSGPPPAAGATGDAQTLKAAIEAAARAGLHLKELRACSAQAAARHMQHRGPPPDTGSCPATSMVGASAANPSGADTSPRSTEGAPATQGSPRPPPAKLLLTTLQLNDEELTRVLRAALKSRPWLCMPVAETLGTLKPVAPSNVPVVVALPRRT